MHSRKLNGNRIPIVCAKNAQHKSVKQVHPTDAHSAAYGTLHATLQQRTRTLGGACIEYVYHAMRRSKVFCAGQSTRKDTTVLPRGGRENRNADFVCDANLKPAGFGHAHPVTNDGRANNLQILLPSGHQVEMALKHVMHVTLRSLREALAQHKSARMRNLNTLEKQDANGIATPIL